MLKAELGDALYYIIFAVVILAGFLEKMAKAKRQQAGRPAPPHSDDEDFEDVEHHPSEAPPQSLEEIMRRMMQTVEAPQPEEVVSYSEEAQSLEIIPDTPYFHYQPVVNPMTKPSEIFSPSLVEEQIEAGKSPEYEFDIRQAVIASEILNKKY